ncbi:DNA starvation/stationary phase protection protein [Actinomyces sp. zg-332]|nr:DNA starvation/stationary phase protection protein [Actinomyces sp. zg-332]QPK94751.1 DNA starvation/stationary phase protection protein [Actinomyces sp. zg-332]
MSIVEKSLQQTLVDLIALSLQGKQAHWNIQGKEFRSLHLQLDEIIDQLRESYDEVAERLVAIGTYADGREETIYKTSTVPPLDEGFLGTDKVYTQFEERLVNVSKNIAAMIDDVDESDHVSADMLIGICAILDKQAWMLRSSK